MLSQLRDNESHMIAMNCCCSSYLVCLPSSMKYYDYYDACNYQLWRQTMLDSYGHEHSVIESLNTHKNTRSRRLMMSLLKLMFVCALHT